MSSLRPVAAYSAPLRSAASAMLYYRRIRYRPSSGGVSTLYSIPRYHSPPQPRRFLTSTSNSSPLRTFPPGPSPLRRILKFSALAIIFTSTGFLLAASPAIRPIIALMSAPTDSETLSLYSAPDAFAAEIDSKILNHPLSLSLRADSSYSESRPHLRLPESLRKHSLTAGTLLGPGRITVPPLTFVQEGKKLVSISYLSTDLCGHAGIVHGGLLATLLDEGMARCCFAALPNKIGVTAKLTVNYRAPAPAGGFVVLKAEVVKVEGRKVWVQGRIEVLGEGPEEGKVLVEAEGLFVEPKYAKALPKLFTVQS